MANRQANLCIEYKGRETKDKIRNLVTTTGYQRLAKEVLMRDRLAVPRKVGMPSVSCHCLGRMYHCTDPKLQT